jgi:alkylation response protein AidB-like acyl-CoA dehydrogenase
MSDYQHPQDDALFVLNEVIGFDQLCNTIGAEECNSELAAIVLNEAGKLGSQLLAPLNSIGDKNPPKLESNGVQETAGYKEAYTQFVDGGWNGLTSKEEYMGQNLPNVLGTAVNEIWQSANLAFALCPLLNQGAVAAVTEHASEELKAEFLEKMVSGEWTGTMNLTEPDAGSDLAAIRSTATPLGDHYLVKGQKIFITWGDHQMTDNIVHLVLARLPDAPAGVKGISLFLVPKYLKDETGNYTQRNDAHAIALEHKLGIHSSPTCVMSFGDQGGAVGYLIGEANKGLAYMFTMMNHARQSVGLQGLSIAERARQQSVSYARDRIQGRSKNGDKLAIIEFPDVRRMLLMQRAATEAMRAFVLEAAAEIDRAHHDADNSSAQKRVELYTPIVKGWMTELAQEVCSLNVQIHGGMGFIEETGAAQHLRDARILPIYEGTTGIQALDLVGRKTLLDQGEIVNKFLSEVLNTAHETARVEGLTSVGEALANSVKEAQTAVKAITASDLNQGAAISFDYLMGMGYLCGGWMLARSATAAKTSSSDSYSSDFIAAKLATVQFYIEYLLPRAQTHLGLAQKGLDSLFKFEISQF